MQKLNSAKNVILRGAALLASLQIFEQLTGLLTQTLIAAYFGASARTDAYLVAVAVLSLITMWATAPIGQVLIPMFRHDLARKGEREAWQNASVLLNNLAVIFVVLAAAGWFVSPVLVRMVAAGFDEHTSALTVSLTRIALTAVVTIGIASFLSQIWYSYQRFWAPGMAGIAANLAGAATIAIAAGTWGIYALALAVVIGYVAELAVQSPILWQNRHQYRFRIDFRHDGMKELWSLSLPIFLSTGGRQIDRITNRFFGSLLPAGSISALSYALLLIRFPEKVMFLPFQKATFPHFTRLIAEERYPELSRQVFQYVRFIVFLAVPALVGMILLGDLVVKLVYQRGAFDERAVQLTSYALAFYAVGLPASFVGRVFNNTFLSLKDTRTVMRISLLRIGVKIALAVVLIPFLAHGGIALAESLSHYVRAGLYYLLLPAQVRGDEGWKTAKSFTGTIAATAVMAFAVWGLRYGSISHLHVMLQLAALVPIGVVTYFATSWFSKQGELEWIGKSLVAITRR